MQSTPAPSSTASSGTALVEKGLEGFSVLNSSIDLQKVSCLNESSSHTVRDLLKGGGDKFLESDCDDELLLHLVMNSVSRIRAIRFTTLPSEISKAPKTIKIFVNKPNLGFDDVDTEAAHEETLTEAQASGKEAVQLRFVRFQQTSSISIFVKDNQGGDDLTRIDKIELIGMSVDFTDVSKIDREPHSHD